MAYLMHISFDNSCRLRRAKYLFEYMGLRFRLIQDNRKVWADHLLTILKRGDMTERQKVFFVASEFLSAVSWQNRSRVSAWESGGRGWHESWPLSRAKPAIRDHHRTPFSGSLVRFGIDRIPKIETNDQRLALTLYREAVASNNDYLAFLFFWHVLSVGGTKASNVADKAQRKDSQALGRAVSDIDTLPLNGRTLGTYLREDGRDAIAHMIRKPGKRALRLDDVHDRSRVALSTRVVQYHAREHIRGHLGLSRELYLKRKGKNGFPTFVDPSEPMYFGWRRAYSPN